MDNQKFWFLILLMLSVALALVASMCDVSPIVR
jgi:hypothetical protein